MGVKRAWKIKGVFFTTEKSWLMKCSETWAEGKKNYLEIVENSKVGMLVCVIGGYWAWESEAFVT